MLTEINSTNSRELAQRQEIKAVEGKSTADAIEIIDTVNSVIYEKDMHIRQVIAVISLKSSTGLN